MPILYIFLWKYLGLVLAPWMCKIDWCKGHWCGSMYMAMRLSDISSKTAKKVFFVLLGHFWAYVGEPHGHIGWAKSMPFASINQSYYPKDPSRSIWQKNIENWPFGKMRFFWVGHFGFFFRKKNNFFLLNPMKNSQRFLDSNDGLKFWWLPAF